MAKDLLDTSPSGLCRRPFSLQAGVVFGMFKGSTHRLLSPYLATFQILSSTGFAASREASQLHSWLSRGLSSSAQLSSLSSSSVFDEVNQWNFMLGDFCHFTPERCLAGFSSVYDVFANTNTCQLAGLLKPVQGPTRCDFVFEQLHTTFLPTDHDDDSVILSDCLSVEHERLAKRSSTEPSPLSSVPLHVAPDRAPRSQRRREAGN